MKLAYVLPRYGTEILGGAEQAARTLAEAVVQRPGWSVEVFTTCALDAGTFADDYPPGTTTESGVVVHRFPAKGRDADFDRISNEILFAAPEVQERRSDEWINAQGPVSPELLAALRNSDADLVAFHPYLYHPTVVGIREVGERPVILHPATHDERPIYLPVFDDVFAAADGIVFWTRSEQAFANQRFMIGATPQLVLGIGVEAEPGTPEAAQAALGLGDAPYVLCLGRVDISKGTDLLVSFFAAYKDRNPGPLKLVLAGPVRHAPIAHPDVIVAGPVDAETKWGLLRGADALISPSPLESFSIVVLESWIAGTPVLVNGACQPTRDHASDANGGLWFTDYGTFEGTLGRLVGDPALRAALAINGRAYVDRRYAQAVLTDRYLEFCTAVARLHDHARSLNTR
jgi:glycosyltransferase involved in cell wall biosynthesis